ncbi:hypothetical protein CEXT_491651 [Caerostris extrusa]|uniref:Uncharacterized protein n=1 Tax=Caerostris extrusa TaxID=172846 RepID=A0AAV4U350_CAEEX|nr:hypothetical protein CEXT_491651 [Caerostris extrusa]
MSVIAEGNILLFGVAWKVGLPIHNLCMDMSANAVRALGDMINLCQQTQRELQKINYYECVPVFPIRKRETNPIGRIVFELDELLSTNWMRIVIIALRMPDPCCRTKTRDSPGTERWAIDR